MTNLTIWNLLLLLGGGIAFFLYMKKNVDSWYEDKNRRQLEYIRITIAFFSAIGYIFILPTIFKSELLLLIILILMLIIPLKIKKPYILILINNKYVSGIGILLLGVILIIAN